jgi:hypothetical protein
MIRALLVLAVLSGCAPFLHISPVGPDTYAAETGAAHVGREAAVQFCTERGKQVLVTNSTQRFDGATTIFRCLSPGDPDLKRPTYQQR